MFHLSTVLVANFLGVLLVLVMLVSGVMKLTDNKSVKKYLLLLTLSVLVSCVADSLAFGFDGRSVPGARFCVYLGNTWLYFSNICISFFWMNVMLRHLNITIGKAHKAVILGIISASSLLLLVNLFTPVVFSVDARNSYQRGALFALYTAVNLLILLDCVLIYLRARKRSGGLTFFPVWVYIVPGLLGLVIQSVFYGISVIGPCAAISVAGLVISLQGEALMKDKLTGLYNRYYLDRIQEILEKDKRLEYTLLMLDMDRFKAINDRYGHAEGDRALVKATELLTEAVKNAGTVVRYAGDEFVVVLYSQDDGIIREQTDRIEKAFSEYKGRVPYELSVSIGMCKMNAAQRGVNEALSLADTRMYENKKKRNSGKSE